MNKEELKLENYSQATLGAGCFWCVEAVFQRIEGVVFVESGYSNGHVTIQLMNKFVVVIQDMLRLREFILMKIKLVLEKF